MSLQDSELPVALEDLANFRLRHKEAEGEELLLNNDQDKTAGDFLNELEIHLTMQKPDYDSLYALYDYKFNKISQFVFDSKPWPKPEDLENITNKSYQTSTHYYYNELRYRHQINKASHLKLNFQQQFDTLNYSWENYLEIFDTFDKQKSIKQDPLPSSWIWDIIDEFVYQYCFASKLLRPQKDYKEQQQALLGLSEDSKKKISFWNLNDVIAQLEKNIDYSGIREKNGQSISKQNNNQAQQTLTFFGYFSLVGLMRVYVLTCQFEKAIETIQIIDFESLYEYSKAVPSYLTLFYYAGFSYFMTQRYKEAVKVFEAIVLFFCKYKTFLTKSFQFDNMCKQSEKCLHLLALSLVFYPTQVEDSIYQMFKDLSYDKKQYQQEKNKHKQEKLWDKYEKILKNDQVSVEELFKAGAPKISPLIEKSWDQFMSQQIQQEDQIYHALITKVKKEYERVITLNNITSILKLYSQINLSKAAQLLNLTQDELKQFLILYNQRNQQNIRENIPFESTILKRFLVDNIQLEFKINNDVLSVTQLAPPKNYTKHFQNQNIKIIQSCQELENLTAL